MRYAASEDDACSGRVVKRSPRRNEQSSPTRRFIGLYHRVYRFIAKVISRDSYERSNESADKVDICPSLLNEWRETFFFGSIKPC